MTGPRIFTLAELDWFREQLAAPGAEPLGVDTCIRLCTNIAWLLGTVKGQQEQLALHQQIGETYSELRELDLQNAGSQATVSQLTKAFDEIDATGAWSGRFGSDDMSALADRYRAARVVANDFKHLLRLTKRDEPEDRLHGDEANR